MSDLLLHTSPAATAFAPNSSLSYGGAQAVCGGGSGGPSLLVRGEYGSIAWWPRDPNPHRAGARRGGAAAHGRGGATTGCARIELTRAGEVGAEVTLVRDDWVSGGVIETLREALGDVSHATGPAREASACHGRAGGGLTRTTAEEAARDGALLCALLNSSVSGAATRPASLFGSPMLPLSPPRPTQDASRWRPHSLASAVARVSSEGEIMSVLRWAREEV